MHVIQTTNLTTKCTHISFDIDDKAKYNALVGNPLYKHIVFTDHKNIPDTKPIKDTLKVSQVNRSNYISNDGNLALTTAFLPCSCKPYLWVYQYNPYRGKTINSSSFQTL